MAGADLDPLAPPAELLEMCEQSLDEMGTVFHESNIYMLHMMYQAMGVCLYMEDPEEAVRYGEKIVKCYRCTSGLSLLSLFFLHVIWNIPQLFQKQMLLLTLHFVMSQRAAMLSHTRAMCPFCPLGLAAFAVVLQEVFCSLVWQILCLRIDHGSSITKYDSFLV